jgi:hypothetical protein
MLCRSLSEEITLANSQFCGGTRKIQNCNHCSISREFEISENVWNVCMAFFKDARSGIRCPRELKPVCSELSYRSVASLLKVNTALISC